MSYVANQYNYATPLSGVVGLVGEQSAVADNKYFTLFDNVLDGSYRPISGDAGLWSSSLSDDSGNLSTPFIITVAENMEFNAFRLQGSQYVYPVAFTVTFYNGSTVIYTIAETSNSSVSYIHYMRALVRATKYEIRITRISRGNAAARLYNLYNPGYVKRADNIRMKSVDASSSSSLHEFFRPDTLIVRAAPNRELIATTSSSDRLRVVNTESAEHTHRVGADDMLRCRTANSTSILNTIDVTRDYLRVKIPQSNHLHKTLGVATDRLTVMANEDVSHVINNIDGSVDICPIAVSARSFADLMNVHSIMKGVTRHIYGKVYITYTDPMLDSETRYVSSGTAYNSVPSQVADNVVTSDGKFFTLYENNLTGEYRPSDEQSQVGWVSSAISDASGAFTGELPYLRIEFSSRPVVSLPITFDTSRGSVAKDFTLAYEQVDGNVITKSITGNTAPTVVFDEPVPNVVAVTITVSSITKAGYPVAILEIPVMSTQLYVGYQDRSDLISIDLLEELTYDDEIEALGGISANSITVVLDNSKRDFYFNNKNSLVASQLKRNRKIVPWLGVEITPGEIEWYTLGTFWSYRWDVPVEGLTAKVVGFDTLGLLDKTEFRDHVMQVNKSIGYLIEYVLSDARKQLDFIEYNIDPSLYDIIIPYAWFSVGGHTAALRRISQCYPVHIYCNRNGVICAAPQKLHHDYYYDTWSDNTNVISKNYNSLYTTLPNIINVAVKQPAIKAGETLVDDNLTFSVTDMPTRTLNFSSPYVSGITVTVDCDATVNYTYAAYSWGIDVNFTGTGNVRSIKCVGSMLDISSTSTVSNKNLDSIRQNGSVTRDISSDFIQTSAHALELINRLLTLSEQDKYDVEVKYRGDISLTINDPILLLDGIAPDNRYNIKRHELSWNGSLTGSAYLNT
jgi:hypothetical protein